MTEQIPASWYNILADLDIELPPDRRSPGSDRSSVSLRVPPALIRQQISRQRDVPIPDDVRERYAKWRTTPLCRATASRSGDRHAQPDLLQV